MIKYTNKRLGKLLGTVSLCSSLFIGSANAGIINGSFDDLGLTTLDTVSGLEWLDLTETRGRSILDVQSELSSTSGYTAIDGWRYATQTDFIGMTSRWFKIPQYSINQPYRFFSNDNDLVDLFIGTFGDTGDASFDEINASFDAAPGEHLSSSGILADTTRGFSLFANVRDDDMVFRSNGRVLTPGRDQIDFGRIASHTENRSIGHFLVRDFQSSAVEVSEPATLAILGLGLLGLSVTRRSKL